MNMRKITLHIICSLLLILTSCEKDTEPKNFAPRLTTGEATEIYRKGASLLGNIEKSDLSIIKEYGILYSTLQSMAEYIEIKVQNEDENNFIVRVKDLEPGRTYYYCSYAYSGYSIAKGEIRNFTTVNSSKPIFNDPIISNMDEKSFTVSTSILDDGGSEISVKGFCWKETSNETDVPQINDESKNLDVSDEYQWRVGDLKPGHRYAVRAFAINGSGLGYGNTAYVTTLSTDLPVVSSCILTDSTSTSISISSLILSNASSVIEKGFCYSSTKKQPTITDTRKISTTPDTEIFGTINDLEPGVKYYIRAYAINGQGVGYSDVFEFIPLPSEDIPTIKVNRVEIDNITAYSVHAVSSITCNSDLEVAEKGFCFDKKSNPSIEDTKIISNASSNDIEGSITGLEESSKYYIRAYAIDKHKISYGETIEFSTLTIIAPTVQTHAASEVTETGAKLSGTVASEGNGTIENKGFCWVAGKSDPTIYDNREEVIASGSNFSLLINKLSPGQNYSFRAYAINEKGIGYGPTMEFTTQKSIELPTISDITISEIMSTSFKATATITNEGNGMVEIKGYCYLPGRSLPTIDDNQILTTQNGMEITTVLSGLSAKTTYTLRAFARNEKGIAYSNPVTITTKKEEPSSEDVAFPDIE